MELLSSDGELWKITKTEVVPRHRRRQPHQGRGAEKGVTKKKV